MSHLTPNDLLNWIAAHLSSKGRIAHLKITRREFQFAGILYKCDNGPWRDSLNEAIGAHRYKHAYKAEQERLAPK